MILLNMGAKYLEMDLVDSHRQFLSSKAIRRIIILKKNIKEIHQRGIRNYHKDLTPIRGINLTSGDQSTFFECPPSQNSKSLIPLP